MRYGFEELAYPLAGKGFQCLITIDGLSAVGKGPLCETLISKSNFAHLDVGALFRALALLQYRNHWTLPQLVVSLNNKRLLIDHTTRKIRFAKVRLTDEEIHSPLTDSLVANVSDSFWLRDILFAMVRDFAQGKMIVADGREAGSYIFPYAQLKYVLRDTLPHRVARRRQEYAAKGKFLPRTVVKRNLLARDARDVKRAGMGNHHHVDGAKVLDGRLPPRENVRIILEDVEGILAKARRRAGGTR